MYSYEDRIRAVQLYIKLGKRIKATIQQLGYPTKNALKGWHREYQRQSDLPLGCAHRAFIDVQLRLCRNATASHPKIKAWLSARPRWHMHFIPTYSSWLNQANASSR